FFEARLPILRDKKEQAQQSLKQFQLAHSDVELSLSKYNLLDDIVELAMQREQLKLYRDLFVIHFDPTHFIVKDLRQKIDEKTKQLSELIEWIDTDSGLEANLLRLYYEADLSSILFEAVVAELSQMRDLASVQSDDYVVVAADIAEPRLTKPRPLLILLLSAIFGLMLSVFYVVLQSIWKPILATATMVH